MKIRTDLADCGVYVFSFNLYKLMLFIQQEINYQWLLIGEDFIPFLARNQFKALLNKHFNEVQKEKVNKKTPQQIKDCSAKIEMLMNPDKEIMKDHIKVMGHIDKQDSPYVYMRIKSIKGYKRANLEG
jgi:hypothetical protein